MKKKIAIIGSGIFGLTIAKKLSKIVDEVHLFEKNKNSTLNATVFNHNRHHYGFHYPRSSETVIQCLDSKDKFERQYKYFLDFEFQNYYAIAKNKTNVTSAEYQKFLNKFKLKYKKKFPENLFNKKYIDDVFLVKEGVYNSKKLINFILNKIEKNKKIKIFYNHDIKKIINETKLSIQDKNNITHYNYDYLINCTYQNINNLLSNEERKRYEYNLQEMAIIQVKNFERFGATVMDGKFPSVLPIANTKNLYYFAHVKYSQIYKKNSKVVPSFFDNKTFYKSNYHEILNKSLKYLNILNQSKYINSFYSVRVVNKNNNDSRTSEINETSKNIFSIFSGKIITVESISDKIYEIIKKRI